MRRFRSIVRCGVSSLVAVSVASCGATAIDTTGLGGNPVTAYTLTPIGTQFGDSSEFVGLNDDGTLVGQVWVQGQPENVAIRHGILVEIGTCQPVAINDSGAIACSDGSILNGNVRTTIVSSVGGLVPTTLAMNDAGQIAGDLVTTTGTPPSCGPDCTFLWWSSSDTAIVSGRASASGFVHPGPPVPRLNIASGLVNVTEVSHNPPVVSFLPVPNLTQTLGCSGIDNSAEFFAIGGNNVLVGQSGGNAISCSGGTMTILGFGSANDISRRGLIVGNTGGKGFVYDGTSTELLDDGVGSTQYSIVSGDLVNDSGQIIARAKDVVTGRTLQVLLTRE